MAVDSNTERVTVALREAALKVADLEQRKREPIALVSMACRFPGGATTPEKFWQILLDQTDALVDIPKDRFDTSRYFNEDPEAPGTIYTRRAYLVKDVAGFDAQFFNISPREARMMDPQQRLLLELSWEALERAAIVPSNIKGSATGVFIGAMNQEYSDRIDHPEKFDPHSASGNLSSALAGRISFFYGTHGPSLVIDTACSSSLVAIHQAIQSLRLEEGTMAIVGGVYIMCSPKFTLAECRARMLSADGRCKSFDARADGYARGEGAAVIILKRLRDAVRDRDPIVAVIRGSAINHDGRSAGMTVPSSSAQTSVLQAAMQQSGCTPKEIQYIEAHGTGTALGDPIEVNAIAKVFRNQKKEPLLISTVKTNIGHLEGAAGIAGVCKTALALQSGVLPATRNLETLSSHVDWNGSGIQVVREVTPWPSNTDIRRAGVSSFGFAGTNAHIVMEQAPSLKTSDSAVTPAEFVLTLSAKSQLALMRILSVYALEVEKRSGGELQSICYTANASRTSFAYRCAVCGNSGVELAKQLRSEGERLSQEVLAEVVHSDEFVRPETEAVAASAFLRGATIDWDAMYANYPVRRVVAPTYQFEHTRYWLDDESITMAVEQDQGGSNVIDEYYSALSSADASLEYSTREQGNDDRFLTFGPIAEKIPGFSWILAQAFPNEYPEFVSRIVQAQNEMRTLLFGEVEFANVTRVLDFGCGYGTDLRQLAKEHQHITCCGYTISRGQAEVGADRVKAQGLDSRISIFNKDSARDTFPGMFDLAFGFEVVHHIPEKAKLFANLSRSLRDGGSIVLADFISRTQFAIEHEKTSSFFSTPEEWTNLLADHGFTIVDLIDISPEVSNFLDDPNFEENLARAKSTNSDSNVEAAIRSYHQLGKLFARGLASYSLFRIEKKVGESREKLAEQTARWIATPCSYRERSESSLCYGVDWVPANASERGASINQLIYHFSDETAKAAIAYFNQSDAIHEVDLSKDSVESTWAGEVSARLFFYPMAGDSRGAHRLLELIKAFGSTQKYGVLRVITFGALDEQAHDIVPGSAVAWGLVRAALEEYPDAQISIVDLQSGRSEIESDLRIINTLKTRGQFRIRLGQVAEPTLVKRVLNNQENFLVHSDRSYVVTGASGGLGAVLVQWLLDQGASHLALLSRSGNVPSFERITEQQRACVRGFKADVSNAAQMADVCELISSTMPAVTGVIHCAGILDDAPLADLNAERFDSVLSPKVQGAHNLYKAFGSKKDVLWIHITSMAGVLASQGQGNYAAANCFLDSFSSWQRRQGVSSYSVQFGPIRNVGMAVGEVRNARFKARGISAIPASLAVSALKKVLAGPPSTTGIIRVDWRTFLGRYPDPMASMIRPYQSDELSGSSALEKATRLFPPGLPRSERERSMTTIVQGLVAKVLGLEVSEVGVRKGFFDLGMDSLIAVDLRNELLKVLRHERSPDGKQISIPSTAPFTYPTVLELATFLVECIGHRDETRLEDLPVNNSVPAMTLDFDDVAWSQIESSLEQLEGVL